ncbi:tagatose 6-phosphate kinase [Murinocardiopsis flavida]|uniref:Tagatose 6-phosphate kinase n=1 Tax=Murinocardiopsis flavida TaxID=645275 RepID=A0A2P8DML3_9ACTN|nr:hexose kinase [Murinocardiopsis flavida]PSK98455.1 tagatose 6-phosphate kinase [Murinocardiopsis flavida]
MILTVTPNPALDVTYRFPELHLGATNRVAGADRRAGGKGVNVARVLHALGHPVTATAPLAGPTGAAIRADLDRSGIRHACVDAAEGDSRRTVTAIETGTGRATCLNESGPVLSEDALGLLCDRVEELIPAARALVLSGSLPRGAPADTYLRLVRIGRAAGRPVLLDTEGEPLLAALPAGPDLVKPNADELARSTGCADPAEGARLLLERGARAAAVSLGAAGLLLRTRAGAWRARPHRTLTGNPTGAGDALAAAFARAAARGQPWHEALAEAVALAAAAVARPLAGDVCPGTAAEFAPRVEITPDAC